MLVLRVCSVLYYFKLLSTNGKLLPAHATWIKQVEESLQVKVEKVVKLQFPILKITIVEKPPPKSLLWLVPRPIYLSRPPVFWPTATNMYLYLE